MWDDADLVYGVWEGLDELRDRGAGSAAADQPLQTFQLYSDGSPSRSSGGVTACGSGLVDVNVAREWRLGVPGNRESLLAKKAKTHAISSRACIAWPINHQRLLPCFSGMLQTRIASNARAFGFDLLLVVCCFDTAFSAVKRV